MECEANDDSDCQEDDEFRDCQTYLPTSVEVDRTTNSLNNNDSLESQESNFPCSEALLSEPGETDQCKDIKRTDSVSSSVKNDSKLCGYLSKLNSHSFLKNFRRRWFVFSEKTCKLYYFRTPEDRSPLGEIDISQATFTFDVTNSQRPGIFTISVPGRDYILEAKDRHACLFWLQELQKFRKHYSAKQTYYVDIRTRTEPRCVVNRPNSGLLGLASLEPELSMEEGVENEPPLMTVVDRPEGVVGEEVSHEANVNNPLIAAQQRLNHFKNQVVTSVAAVRNRLPSDVSSPGSLSTPNEPIVSSSSVFYVPTNPSENHDASPTSSCDADISPTSKNKNPVFNSLRLKLQRSFRSKTPEIGKVKNGDSCSKCKKLEESAMYMSEQLCTLEDELLTSKEVISTLHKQLDVLLREKETLFKLDEVGKHEETAYLLLEKDNQVDKLVDEVQKHEKENKDLQTLIMTLKNENEQLKEKLEVYQECIKEKDKVVVTLINDMFDMEVEKREQEWHSEDRTTSETSNTSNTSNHMKISDTCDPDELKDALQAFELQNKFLNQEILELNQLRWDSEKRENRLLTKCSEWEARCCQIQSKLLFLLKELDKPSSGINEHTQDVVSRLLHEAMNDTSVSQNQYTPTWGSEVAYDELGFNWKWGKEDLLSTKASNLQERSEAITNKMKDPVVMSWRVKWENFIVSLANRELPRTLELKGLLRSGIPDEYRGVIWKACVDWRVKSIRAEMGKDYYSELLSAYKKTSGLDPSAKQIELDLLRTLPNNKHYETLDANGIPPLRRVLQAYSKRNPAVGYCQGLNRLAAISLLFLEEEDAFWCLVAIVEKIMPSDYYSKTLKDSQVDQAVLKDLLAEKSPRLHSHLEQQNVDLSLFTFSWFLTVFVDSIPVQTYLRIWDAFLYEGSKVLFRFALAIFKMCETNILQMNDYMTLNRYLRTIGEQMKDVKRLAQIAFNAVNPLPMKTIIAKRAHHLQIVNGQLEELEALRQSLPQHDEEGNADFLSDDD